jgi:hypothetical protein
MLFHEVSPILSIHPHHMDRALALDITVTCDTAYFGGTDIILLVL